MHRAVVCKSNCACHLLNSPQKRAETARISADSFKSKSASFLRRFRAFLRAIKLLSMNPTQRFSDRVENYIRYRPGYPPAILDTLRAECHLTPASIIADVGSGTGILAELFLRNGNTVYGIEPNAPMREAGERLLVSYPNFHSIPAQAEATTLPDNSVDFVTAGQAFHWFDRERCLQEFKRILQPGGWVVLVWNERLTDVSPFARDYEQMLHTHGTDYAQVNHVQISDEGLEEFYKCDFSRRTFDNVQVFDFEGLRGRLLSSSYAPTAGQPGHTPMLEALRVLFDSHQQSGKVAFDYATNLYFGRLE